MANIIIQWENPSLTKPPYDVPVLAVVEQFSTKQQVYTILIAVDEDDCEWRCVDASYKPELSHNWNVIKWALLPRLKGE